jgi:hypothetical protein
LRLLYRIIAKKGEWGKDYDTVKHTHMKRKEGYYWVKIDTSTEELKYHGNHWQAALWYCNNGDGSDLLWRIAGDDTRFDDDDFSEINETRIVSPDELADKQD